MSNMVLVTVFCSGALHDVNRPLQSLAGREFKNTDDLHQQVAALIAPVQERLAPCAISDIVQVHTQTADGTLVLPYEVSQDLSNHAMFTAFMQEVEFTIAVKPVLRIELNEIQVKVAAQSAHDAEEIVRKAITKDIDREDYHHAAACAVYGAMYDELSLNEMRIEDLDPIQTTVKAV